MTYEEFGKAYLTAIIKAHSSSTTKADEGMTELVALVEAYPEFEAKADADDALWSKANILKIKEAA